MVSISTIRQVFVDQGVANSGALCSSPSFDGCSCPAFRDGAAAVAFKQNNTLGTRISPATGGGPSARRERELASLIDDAHAAAADLAQELEIPQSFNGQGRLRWGAAVTVRWVLVRHSRVVLCACGFGVTPAGLG